jgi:predicted enzyme related to lactoylglutathione lyase
VSTFSGEGQRQKETTMNEHEKINYVEFPSINLNATKSFFSKAFGWSFQDFGLEYTAFSNVGLDGGFFKSELKANTANGSALIVFYSSRIEDTLSKVVNAGGSIVKEIFSFPGGRRFHFIEPSGNEFAVWSDKDA